MRDRNIALDLHGIMTRAQEQQAAERAQKAAALEERAAEIMEAEYWPKLIDACTAAAHKGFDECAVVVKEDAAISNYTDRHDLQAVIASKLASKARRHGFRAADFHDGRVKVDWRSAAEMAAMEPQVPPSPELTELGILLRKRCMESNR